MALNLSQEITKIKMKMGIYGISIPIEDPNAYIRETIETMTIPTFSLFQPYYMDFHVNTDQLEKACLPYQGKVSDDRSAYKLPEFKNQKLLSVADVKYSDDTSINYSGVGGYAIAGMLPYSNSSLMQQVMLTGATSNLYQTMYPRLTYDFIEPNTLIVYNKIVSNSLKLTLAFEHHKSLATIPSTCEKSFFELALYDTEINFYQVAKHWGKLETAIGNIELNIDDWANAEDKRQQLLDDWMNLYHLDIPASIVYK